MSSYNKNTEWIDKILNNKEQHFDIVVRFAEEAQRRLGRKKDE